MTANMMDYVGMAVVGLMLVLVVSNTWADTNAYWLMGIGVGFMVRGWLK